MPRDTRAQTDPRGAAVSSQPSPAGSHTQLGESPLSHTGTHQLPGLCKEWHMHRRKPNKKSQDSAATGKAAAGEIPKGTVTCGGVPPSCTGSQAVFPLQEEAAMAAAMHLAVQLHVPKPSWRSRVTQRTLKSHQSTAALLPSSPWQEHVSALQKVKSSTSTIHIWDLSFLFHI